VEGKRFSEITASSRTGHLQKGHAVAIGDWRRRGVQDLFVQLGGATYGDRYHNVLFDNPGHGNNWLSIKLIGKKTNRAAIGARIKVVTAGARPPTGHRPLTAGSSVGAHPPAQHTRPGDAAPPGAPGSHSPAPGTTQVFHDVAVDQAIEITEFAEDYKKRPFKPIALPAE